jgi:hypothetical protein
MVPVPGTKPRIHDSRRKFFGRLSERLSVDMVQDRASRIRCQRWIPSHPNRYRALAFGSYGFAGLVLFEDMALERIKEIQSACALRASPQSFCPTQNIPHILISWSRLWPLGITYPTTWRTGNGLVISILTTLRSRQRPQHG